MKAFRIVSFAFAIAFAALVSFSSFSQPLTTAPLPGQLVMVVSSMNGAYGQMGQQIQAACPSPSVDLKVSVQGINDLLNNKGNVAFLTTDSLYARKLIEKDSSVDQLKVLMPLYNAELHMVARRADANVNRFSDLGNKRVGTYGAGYVTARISLATANLRPLSVQDYSKETDVLAALSKNEIDVAFMVIGQPAAWAEGLSGNTFKLVEFDRPDLMGKNGYVSASLRYPNLSATAVPTMATKVNLVTYDYDSPKKVAEVSSLKKCITTNYKDIRDTNGNHAKWREVNPTAKSDWPMFAVAAEPTGRQKK